MQPDMLASAIHALQLLLEPTRLMVLFLGVVIGLAIGVLPGLSGIVGLAMLIPFTYHLDEYTAFALLLGMAAVITSSDFITAVLFGVPGHVGAAATVIDGHAMAKKGEAGRAFGAGFAASLAGGVVGAIVLGISIPILRPLMLSIGSPELLAFTLFGMSMVATLSGRAPLKGLTAAGLGLMIAMVGSRSQTGTLRWTFGWLYLWDGVPLIPATLGIFALPELCELAVSRRRIAGDNAPNINLSSQWQGVRDVAENWWLVLRCSVLGTGLGAIPGIGSAVIDWIAYGYAQRTEKNSETFGTGDVRGVIAAESATNAREGGALVPTVAFGVPSSAGMAILLGAFLIHGLVPGPEMLTKHLDITYSMVWSIAIANILGSGLCFAFSGQLAKVATLRYTLFMPGVLSLIYIGAFEASRNWGDIFSLMFFGMLGWAMKHFKWPRPPLVLGFILGQVIERYMFISIQRYGISWMLRPFVVVMFIMAGLSLLRPLLADVRTHGGVKKMVSQWGHPKFSPENIFAAGLLCLFIAMIAASLDWSFAARIIPTIVGTGAILFCSLSLINDVFGLHERAGSGVVAGKSQKIHMDIASKTAHLPTKIILTRGFLFFGWMAGFAACMALIGLIPTVPIFITAFMRLEGREPWKIVIPMAASVVALIYVVFDQLLAIPWPPTLAGMLFPVLHAIPSV
jgi:TctA family transporter